MPEQKSYPLFEAASNYWKHLEKNKDNIILKQLITPEQINKTKKFVTTLAESIVKNHTNNYNKLNKIAGKDLQQLFAPKIRTLKVPSTNEPYKKNDKAYNLKRKLQKVGKLKSFKSLGILKNHTYKVQAKVPKKTLRCIGQKWVKER